MMGKIWICYVHYWEETNERQKNQHLIEHSVVVHETPFEVGVDYSNTGSPINSFVYCTGRLGPGPKR